jgi:hypothetical protein
MKPFKVNRLAMHQTWYDNNKKLLFLEANIIMQELLAMCRERTAERDEARRIACLQSCMGDDEPREWSPEDFAKQQGWDCFKGDGK